MNFQINLTRKRILFYSFSIIFLLVVFFFELEETPRFWWDEGWTLMVARNWLELGHYGQVMDGKLFPSGLSADFPVVASVAISFKLFGVGVWQGRLPSVFYTLGSFLVLFYLASILYNRAVAYGSLFILFFMSLSHPLHPAIMGRQVMGEPALIFYLLAGYICLWGALKKSFWLIFPAALLWGIALTTKGQAPPFWLASLLLPFFVSLYKRWWRSLWVLVLGIVGTILVFYWLIPWVKDLIIAGNTLPNEPLDGLFWVLGFVPDLSVRIDVWRLVLAYGLPTLIGLFWVFRHAFHELHSQELKFEKEITRLSLVVLVGSWLAWFIFLGIPWDRYLYPSIFVGSIFTSTMLYDLTYKFNWRKTLSQVTRVMSHRGAELNRKEWILGIRSFIVSFWVIISVILSALILFFTLFPSEIESVAEVAYYINHTTPSDSLIETYESELFFFLERRYHYPPDQISLELVRQQQLNPETLIDYDPLKAEPDYLVLGRYNDEYEFYDPWVDNGDFELLITFPGYRIYECVRD